MTAPLPHDLRGNGPCRVLALHGWFSDRHAFDGLLPLLPETDFTVAVPDIRGYGAARAMAGEFTIDEIARDAFDLADSLGWQTFGVIGHSMGGKVAQRMLTMQPERMTKWAGVSPVPACAVPFDAQAAELFASAATSPDARRAILDGSTGFRYYRSWLDRAVDHSLATSSPEAFARYFESWSGDDFHTEFVESAGSRVPAHILVGAHDPSLSAEFMNATLLGWCGSAAQLQIIADAGHYALDETPILAATAIQRFFDESER